MVQKLCGANVWILLDTETHMMQFNLEKFITLTVSKKVLTDSYLAEVKSSLLQQEIWSSLCRLGLAAAFNHKCEAWKVCSCCMVIYLWIMLKKHMFFPWWCFVLILFLQWLPSIASYASGEIVWPFFYFHVFCKGWKMSFSSATVCFKVDFFLKPLSITLFIYFLLAWPLARVLILSLIVHLVVHFAEQLMHQMRNQCKIIRLVYTVYAHIHGLFSDFSISVLH